MLTLRTALATAPYTRALKDGTVTSDRVALDFAEIPRIQDAFPHMVRALDYDVSQMSPTTYLVARSFGKPITAIPVFLNRHFHHGFIVANVAIKTPKDLEGKRVGIGSWTITTGVWGRAVLQMDYGVDIDKVQWVSFEDTHVAEYREPANVVRAAAGKTMNGMLQSGELDAAVAAGVPETGTVRPLIADPAETGAAWYRRTGIYPIVHTVVVNNDLLREHSWLAGELLRMFETAKDRYLDTLCKHVAQAPSAGVYPEPVEGISPDDERILWQSRVLNGDPLPYGIEANRRSIEALVEAAVTQGIIPHSFRVEELFSPLP